MHPFQTPEPPVDGTAASWIAWIIGLAVIAAGGYATWKGATNASRKAVSEGTISLMAEYREALDDLRSELATERAERKAEVAALTSRIDASVSRERLHHDYILALRQHIADGQPPPPPGWPSGLTIPPTA